MSRPIRYRRMPSNLCDVCGKRRGGGNPIDHRKCAETRKKRES